MLTVPRALQQKTSSEFEEIVLTKLTGFLNLCFDNHKARISFYQATTVTKCLTFLFRKNHRARPPIFIKQNK